MWGGTKTEKIANCIQIVCRPVWTRPRRGHHIATKESLRNTDYPPSRPSTTPPPPEKDPPSESLRTCRTSRVPTSPPSRPVLLPLPPLRVVFYIGPRARRPYLPSESCSTSNRLLPPSELELSSLPRQQIKTMIMITKSNAITPRSAIIPP